MGIIVRETVRSWGFEWTEYETDMTVEQVTTAIVEDEDYPDAETVSSVTPSMVADWCADHFDALNCELEVKEIMDRDDIAVTNKE